LSIPSPFWEPSRHADRRPRLLARARFASALRGWFGAEGFVEVEPAALQISPGNETHLHGFATQMIADDGSAVTAYLHTSPEFAMKKLLASGETRLFALARVFRNRERTALHAPEFTMLEWYRAGEGLDALMADCANVLRLAAEAAGTRTLRFRGRESDAYSEPERLSVREAFLTYAGVDLFPTAPTGTAGTPSPFTGEGRGGGFPRSAPGLERPPTLTLPCKGGGDALIDRDTLAEAALVNGLRTAPDDTWSDLFSRLLSAKVEPNLGLGRSTFLTDYPASEAALARLNPQDPRVAERFELYACGVELANAFGELTDAKEQRRRFEEDMALKQKIYGETYPLDEDFLTCLPYLGECAGAALGFDRVVMLACGAETIEDVQWTPVFCP
jgi:lysyl-tRNA synthetase class 2